MYSWSIKTWKETEEQAVNGLRPFQSNNFVLKLTSEVIFQKMNNFFLSLCTIYSI